MSTDDDGDRVDGLVERIRDLSEEDRREILRELAIREYMDWDAPADPYRGRRVPVGIAHYPGTLYYPWWGECSSECNPWWGNSTACWLCKLYFTGNPWPLP